MKNNKFLKLKNQYSTFYFLFSVFCLVTIFSIFYFLFSIPASAQVKLETALPNISNAPNPSSGLPQYINYLFIFGLGAIAFLALAQMMIGGITYILAAGNVAKVEDAKDTIQQALLGLGLLLVSYLLLRTINPDLVNLRNPKLTPISLQIKTSTQSAEEFLKEYQKQFSGSNVNATTGETCSPIGAFSPAGGLYCSGLTGKWEIMQY